MKTLVDRQSDRWMYAMLFLSDGVAGSSVLLCVHKSQVYIFDSHSQNGKGQVVSNGTSVLLKFSKLLDCFLYIQVQAWNMNSLLFDLTEIHVIEQNSMMASYFTEQLLQPHVVGQGMSGVKVTDESVSMNNMSDETDIQNKPVRKRDKAKTRKEQSQQLVKAKCCAVETDEKNTPEVVVKQHKHDKVRDQKDKNKLFMERHHTSQETQSTPDVEMTDDVQASQSEAERPTVLKTPQHDCAKTHREKNHSNMQKVRADNSQSPPAMSDREKCMQKYNEAIAHGPIYVCTVYWQT